VVVVEVGVAAVVVVVVEAAFSANPVAASLLWQAADEQVVLVFGQELWVLVLS
jgi:hypothetical protein